MTLCTLLSPREIELSIFDAVAREGKDKLLLLDAAFICHWFTESTDSNWVTLLNLDERESYQVEDPRLDSVIMPDTASRTQLLSSASCEPSSPSSSLEGVKVDDFRLRDFLAYSCAFMNSSLSPSTDGKKMFDLSCPFGRAVDFCLFLLGL